MTFDTDRERRVVAVSISESPDMAAFGLGRGHLRAVIDIKSST